MSELFCTYCGSPKGERIQCCSECHWMTRQEYFYYYEDWPDDGKDHDDYQSAAIATAQSEAAFEANEREYRK
jgi:hypothetical protein